VGQALFYNGRYFPDLVAEESEHFIRRHRDQPFFLYVAMNTPHYPYQGEEHWLTQYEEAGMPYPRNLYAAFVSSQDERIGRITAYLEELGLRENTIIVFQSDHGHSVEERAHFGGGNAGPYRGAKFSLLEGGIRVPAIISYPGRLVEGEVRDQMVHAMDWLPTLAELCGVEVIDKDLDGRSMAGVLAARDAPGIHETLYWQVRDQWAVRRGSWKLIANLVSPVRGDPVPAADRQWFLVNLDEDPGERRNLKDEHPDLLEELKTARPPWAQ